MSQEQIKRLRSQDLFKMEKTEQDTTNDDASKNDRVDKLSPEVKMVIEEKLKTLKMKKQPIIMPSTTESYGNTSQQGTSQINVPRISTLYKGSLVPVQPKGSTVNVQPKGSPVPVQLKGSPLNVQPKSSPLNVQPKGSPLNVQPKGSPVPVRLEGAPIPVQHKRSSAPIQLKGPTVATQFQGFSMPTQYQGSTAQFQGISAAAQFQGSLAAQFPGSSATAQFQGSLAAAQFQDSSAAAQFQAPTRKFPAGVPRTFVVQTGATSAINPQSYVPTTSQSQPLQASAASQLYFPEMNTFQPNYPVPEMNTLFETAANDELAGADGSESPDALEAGQKRLSAFKRLGPVSQPKKPKLTINLMVNKEAAVREVVDDNTTPEALTHIPVHLRKDVLESTDETVVMFLDKWPWKNFAGLKKTVSSKTPKVAQYQIAEFYDKDQEFIQIAVTGYPPTWTKEDVLDTILDALMGRSFIPCFIEFNQELCKFLVIKCRHALLAISKLDFSIRKGDVKLLISVSSTRLNLKTLNFLPRLRLTKRLLTNYDGVKSISLKAFTLQSDISHFIYFPLRVITNQSDLMQLQSAVAWDRITDLDLSHNKLTCIDGFDLKTTTPKLKHLDLSHNQLDNIHSLLKCRDLGLRSIKLEGNPMCLNYIDPAYYVKVFKTMFPSLVEIDGTPIVPRGQIPIFYKNYCPYGAEDVVEKFLSIYFPLLESYPEERAAMEDLYDEKAVLTITFRYKLRYTPGYRYSRNLFLRSRILEEEEMESVVGASSIVKLLSKWPMVVHDPSSFTVDVLHHNEYSTIIRIGGILKITSETLAEDEHLMTFGRTVVLRPKNDVEYKIQNELLFWDEPTPEYANSAFQFSMAKPRSLKLKLESTPDNYLKQKLVEIFVKLTDLDKTTSERCLQQKDWNIKNALEYFVKLLKLDGLQALKAE